MSPDHSPAPQGDPAPIFRAFIWCVSIEAAITAALLAIF
jgi:hypothetical protein